jgi:hypothetical protein
MTRDEKFRTAAFSLSVSISMVCLLAYWWLS